MCNVYIDSYVRFCSTDPPPPPPTPLRILLHPSPPSLHLLLSNCSRNHSFIFITCRKPAEPKINPIFLQDFLYRPIFPVPFSLESLLPSLCLFLKCPSLTSTRSHTVFQKQLLELIFLKIINQILELIIAFRNGSYLCYRCSQKSSGLACGQILTSHSDIFP